MPIVEYINYEMNNATFLVEANVEIKFAWLPKRCQLTNKWLWLRPAYRATRYWNGERAGAITEHRWFKCHDFLMWRIQNS